MDSRDQSSHEMITRSKSKDKEAIFYEFDEESDFSDDYDDSDNSDDNSEVESDNNSEIDSEEDQDFGDDDLNDGSDVDRHGNIKGLIDYKCKAKFDRDEFQRQLSILGSGGRMRSHSSPKKKKRNAFSRKKKGSKKQLNDVLLSYLIMKATDKANEELKSRARKKKKDKMEKVDKDKFHYLKNFCATLLLYEDQNNFFNCSN